MSPTTKSDSDSAQGSRDGRENPESRNPPDPGEAPDGRAAGGHVTFLGAGPGDPGLLTLRAVQALAEADVLVCDPRVLDAVRHHSRAGVDIAGPAGIGQEPAPSCVSGASMTKLVTSSARAGRRVVRAFEGDPGMDGPAVEEMLACAKAGIPFEVVPGVANGVGVAAYAGIPLRSRERVDVRFVSAGSAGRGSLTDAGASDATLVVSTTLEAVAAAAAELVAGGRKPDTPLTVTVAGTTTRQRTWTATLSTVAAELKAAKALPSPEAGQPAIAVVGEQAAQRALLSWFETKPLFGWRVLVPRTKEQAASLSEQIRSYGAVPHEVPTIAVEPPRTPQQMERAVKGLVTGRYEWIAFTSVNAVRAVREKFEVYGLDARAFAGIKVAAVGEQTARALIDFGVKPDLLPSGQQSAAGLLDDWPPYDPVFDPIDRVLLPRADIATETLVAGLIELGWEVDDVTAYRTVRASPPPAATREAIKGGGFDAVLFTSSSTVRNLVGIAGKPHNVTVVACIGPATVRTAEEHGLRVDVISPEPSVHALAEALAEFGRARRDAAVAAGQPVTRPSERRPTRRRARP